MSHRKKRQTTIAVNEFAFFVVQARSIGFFKVGKRQPRPKNLDKQKQKRKKEKFS